MSSTFPRADKFNPVFVDSSSPRSEEYYLAHKEDIDARAKRELLVTRLLIGGMVIAGAATQIIARWDEIDQILRAIK